MRIASNHQCTGNYYTQFCFAFRINPKAVPWLLEFLQRAHNTEGAATDDKEINSVFPDWKKDPYLGFRWSFGTEKDRDIDHSILIIYDKNGQGKTKSVADFLKAYLRKYAPNERIAFSFANTSSPPKLDAFGGGACVVTAKRKAWIDSFSWIRKKIST